MRGVLLTPGSVGAEEQIRVALDEHAKHRRHGDPVVLREAQKSRVFFGCHTKINLLFARTSRSNAARLPHDGRSALSRFSPST